MNFSIRHWLAEYYIEIPQIRGLFPGQLAGLAFRIVMDMEVKSLTPFDICSLAEVLQLPLSAVWLEITVLAQLTESLLRSLSQNKPLKRNEGTWLAFQTAYLHGLRQVLDQEASLHRPWLDRAIIPSRRHWQTKEEQQTSYPPYTPVLIPLEDKQLQGLLKTLSPGKLSDTQAEQALSVVADSLLVQQMNNATVAWLVANGAEETQGQLIVQRLVDGLPGHLLTVIADNAAPLAQLQKFVRLGTSFLGGDDKIDLYREHYRASLLQSLSQPLFMEFFTLKDIYVSPQGLPRAKNTGTSVDLFTWVGEQLADLTTVAVIESEPGYGKTSFCQMWAATVAGEIYPQWMPIYIRLRDITYGNSLVETLSSGVQGDFRASFAEILALEQPRCLLILDGLDELFPTSQEKIATAMFMQQLLEFQAQQRHKILLTTRSGVLSEIFSEIPPQLQHITIQPWGQNEWRQWFQNWTKVQSSSIAQNFFTLLKNVGAFSSSKLPALSPLVRQPLMLYLLGILHRDGLLEQDILPSAEITLYTASSSLGWEVYHRLHRWLLGYPLTGGIKTMLLRSGSAHIHRSPEAIANLLGGIHPQDLQQRMQGIALEILHSLRPRINCEESIGKILPAFYFNVRDSTVEFSHHKLGEYLCAQAIAARLKLLTQRQENAYGERTFVLESPTQVAEHVYNLLGYGILSKEIETSVIEELRRQLPVELLCERLLSFWYPYCRGRWMDEGIAHKALNYYQGLQNPVNLEQVNAAVGLNVFLLLSACHRELQTPFAPCGNPASLNEFNPQALMTLIARTVVLSPHTFSKRGGYKSLVFLHLALADLSLAMLAGVNLTRTNLSHAELMGANLTGANLTSANLTGANLTGANLTDANLPGTNLTNANLTGVNLTRVNLDSANLNNACLYDAIITDTQRETAIQNGALFSREEFQQSRSSLSQQSDSSTTNPTEDSKMWLNNAPDMGIIESAEGEPIVPPEAYEDQYEDEADIETVFDPRPPLNE
ncbi:MAG: pentapeptide repeat-containing protein [Nostocaceae cyanobacterium]|nr:pentapeptide repeat-containing protein [Nostocaceae cyanobacterium]